MDVFVIPIGAERYELYCEAPVEAPQPDAGASGIIGRIRYRFAVMLHQAEERRRGGKLYPRAVTRLGRFQEWVMAWVAERIAEQRLLWNLRRERTVPVFHPQDLTFEQTLTLITRMLRRDFERHRVWLVVDSLLLI